jgi:hypothetical protein
MKQFLLPKQRVFASPWGALDSCLTQATMLEKANDTG